MGKRDRTRTPATGPRCDRRVLGRSHALPGKAPGSCWRVWTSRWSKDRGRLRRVSLRTLLAEMASPRPVPPKSTALSASPLATASAALMQMTGYAVLSSASATPKSRTSSTRGSSLNWSLIKFLRFTPASSEPTATTYLSYLPSLLLGGYISNAHLLLLSDVLENSLPI